MILHFNYEEIRALESGARVLLDAEGEGDSCVLAPPECRARVEALLPRLDGYFSVTTLTELREVQVAVEAIAESSRVEMESMVLASHPADEDAVAAYFGFAHVLTVASRIADMASEMEALIELLTGCAPTDPVACGFQFPD